MNTVTDYNRLNPGRVWRTYNYDLDNGADIAKYVARTRYAWPGGYELFAITNDGAALCHDCCRSEFRLIAESVRDNPSDAYGYCDGWRVIAVDSTASLDDSLWCDHCDRHINDTSEG